MSEFNERKAKVFDAYEKLIDRKNEKTDYMGGAYVPDRIKGIDKAIMGMVRKMLLDKGLNMNEEERTLLKRVEEGCDLVSREQIEPVVEEFR